MFYSCAVLELRGAQVTEMSIEDASNNTYDVIALPGGKGGAVRGPESSFPPPSSRFQPSTVTIHHVFSNIAFLPNELCVNPAQERLRDSIILRDMLLRQRDERRWVAAICAAPALVLAAHGIITPTTPATCFPNETFTAAIPNKSRLEERVVVSEADRLITSRGPGTAIEFALAIVEQLAGREKAEEVGRPMLPHHLA